MYSHILTVTKDVLAFKYTCCFKPYDFSVLSYSLALIHASTLFYSISFGVRDEVNLANISQNRDSPMANWLTRPLNEGGQNGSKGNQVREDRVLSQDFFLFGPQRIHLHPTGTTEERLRPLCYTKNGNEQIDLNPNNPI